MKKTIILFLSFCMLILTLPTNLKASQLNNIDINKVEKLKEKQSAQILLNRLEELKKLSKTNLSSIEKNNLKIEVMKINNDLKTIGDGLYLSLGTIIIIVILLIILF